MRDIVGPLRRVALDWTPDWTRERTLDSGPWTITGVIHGPGIHVLYTSGKKGERVGYGWEWGNAWSTFNKSSFRYTRFWYTLGLWLVYFDISCQHSEVHYLDWKCDAVAMRCYTAGYLESVVKCFKICNIRQHHSRRTRKIFLRLDWCRQMKVGLRNFTIYWLSNELFSFSSLQEYEIREWIFYWYESLFSLRIQLFLLAPRQ